MSCRPPARPSLPRQAPPQVDGAAHPRPASKRPQTLPLSTPKRVLRTVHLRFASWERAWVAGQVERGGPKPRERSIGGHTKIPMYDPPYWFALDHRADLTSFPQKAGAGQNALHHSERHVTLPILSGCWLIPGCTKDQAGCIGSVELLCKAE